VVVFLGDYCFVVEFDDVGGIGLDESLDLGLVDRPGGY
jgi:hypothetical protein